MKNIIEDLRKSKIWQGDFFRKWIFTIVLLSTSAHTFAQNTLNKPNIIFIMVDNLGCGDLGCYGQIKINPPILIACPCKA